MCARVRGPWVAVGLLVAMAAGAGFAQQTPPVPGRERLSGPPASSLQSLKLYRGKPLAELKQFDNGPGVVVCEPVPRGVAAGLAEFGDGCAHLLSYLVGGHGELGKSPPADFVSEAVGRLKRKNMRLTAAEVGKLSLVLGVTHAVIGEIGGTPEQCRLTLNLVRVADKQPVGKAVELRGSEAAVAAQLGNAATELTRRLGVASPRLPDTIAETPDDLRLFARIGWIPGATITHAHQKALEKTTGRSDLGMLLFLAACSYDSDEAAGATVARWLMEFTRRAGDNALAHAEFARVHQIVSLRSQNNWFAQALTEKVKTYPRTFAFQTAQARLCEADLRYEDAIRAAEEAVRCSAGFTDAWVLLSTMLSYQADEIRKARFVGEMTPAEFAAVAPVYDRRLQIARKVVRLDPMLTSGWVQLSSAAAFAGHGKEADEALWKALRLEPHSLHAISWGLELYQPKWYGDAAKLKQMGRLAVASKPATRRLRMFLALKLARIDDRENALALMRSDEERAELTRLARWTIPGQANASKTPPGPDPLFGVQTPYSHSGGAFAVAWSPDGKTLASGGADRLVKLWKVGEEGTALLHGHASPVTALAWNRDGTRLASGGNDGAIRIWDVPAGKELIAYNAHRGSVRALAWSPKAEVVASAGREGNSYLWDPKQAEPVRQFDAGPYELMSMAFSPDGTRIATGAGIEGPVGAGLRLWEVATGKQLGIGRHKSGMLVSLAWSPDGAWLAATSNDRSLRLWETATVTEKRVLKGLEGEALSVGWSPDGKYLATVGRDAILHLWDREAGRLLASTPPPPNRNPIWSVVWRPDGKSVAASGGSSVFLVNIEKALAAGLAAGPRPGDPVGPDLLTASPTLKLAHTGNLSPRLAFTRDGRWLAVAGSDGKITLHDLEAGQPPRTMQGLKSALFLSFSPDGSRLAVASQYDGVAMLDVASGATQWSWRTGNSPRAKGSMGWVGFSPDGAQLAGIEGVAGLRWWNAATGKLIRATQDDGDTSSAAFSPDGTLFATGIGSISRWGDVNLRNARTGALATFLEGHRDLISAVEFSPDNRTLVTASHDRKLHLWDVKTRKQTRELGGHLAPILEAGFLQDGQVLLSIDSQGTVKLWDTAKGVVRQEITLPTRGPTYFATGRAGKLLAMWVRMAPNASEIQVWKLP